MKVDKKIKIIFMGTPDFACPTLKKLLDDDSIDVVLVVTKEDKPSGRGKEMRESDVKKYFKLYCDEKNINCIDAKCIQQIFCDKNISEEKQNDNESCGCEQCDKYILTPHKIKEDRDVIECMKKIEPDFIIVVAYGQILSKEILDIPKKACINGHASLLPKYRGSSPIQASILAGDKVTGTTAMLMSEGLDEGDILLSKTIDIKPNDTGESLFDKLSIITGDVVLEAIKNYDNIVPIKQNNENASYVKMIKKEDGLIDLKNETFSEIDRKVRGYYPWPGAYIMENGKRIKIFGVKKAENGENIKGKLIYDVKDGKIEILELQVEGKKRMSAKDYLNGLNHLR